MKKLTPEEIAALNEFGEADAWENFYSCAPADFAERFRVETRRIGPLRISMVGGLDRSFFNRIVGAGIGAEASEETLEEAIALYDRAGCRSVMVQLIPGAQKPGLCGWLEARGFVKGKSWAKVYRDASPAPAAPDGLRVESIGTESGRLFAGIVLDAFRMPPELRPFIEGPIGKPGWRHYLAFDGDRAVAAGALYVSGAVGWLGLGSTLDSHRRRGGQGALFARRIADGLAAGCKWFVTETGEDTPEKPNPSYRNMLRAGFTLAYLRGNYARERAPG